MKYDTLLYEKQDGIVTITFHNPEKLNALTDTFLEELYALFEEIQANDDDRVVIFTGEGKAFIAGADISYMATMHPDAAAQYAYKTTELYRKITQMKKVFIAAVNGYALGGGCEFTLACDLRIASKKAKFGLPEVSLGIFPGGGGTQRLPRLIGMAKAKELVYTGKTITADEGERIGLVNRVTVPETLMEEAQMLAQEILKNSWQAVIRSKEAFQVGAQMDIYSAMEVEKNLFALCFASDDQREGMEAFLQKRKPEFR